MKTNTDYEKKIVELEGIVKKLESDVSLEESMALFSNGLDLARDCIDELNRTSEQISELKTKLDRILENAPGVKDER